MTQSQARDRSWLEKVLISTFDRLKLVFATKHTFIITTNFTLGSTGFRLLRGCRVKFDGTSITLGKDQPVVATSFRAAILRGWAVFPDLYEGKTISLSELNYRLKSLGIQLTTEQKKVHDQGYLSRVPSPRIKIPGELPDGSTTFSRARTSGRAYPIIVKQDNLPNLIEALEASRANASEEPTPEELQADILELGEIASSEMPPEELASLENLWKSNPNLRVTLLKNQNLLKPLEQLDKLLDRLPIEYLIEYLEEVRAKPTIGTSTSWLPIAGYQINSPPKSTEEPPEEPISIVDKVRNSTDIGVGSGVLTPELQEKCIQTASKIDERPR